MTKKQIERLNYLFDIDSQKRTFQEQKELNILNKKWEAEQWVKDCNKWKAEQINNI